MTLTSTDVARFALLITLGFFGLLTFLVAATIVGLMWAESSSCNCIHFPIGLYVLGVVGILFIISMINEAVEASPLFEKWSESKREDLIEAIREASIAAIIFLVVVILLLI